MSDITKESIHTESHAKDYIRDYWQERAGDFAALRRKELESPKLLLWQQEIEEKLKGREKGRVLDVGCGGGFFSILLAKAGYDVVGIDLSPAMVNEATRLAKDMGASAKFSVMDAEALDFDEGTFDVVIARNVTWNLPHPAKAYEEWLRVLKKGGVLLNYDAEHAKDHHQKMTGLHAHAGVSDDLLERCHHIYHMLDISLADRPLWDEKVLTALGAKILSIDSTVGERIYDSADAFYIPAPMFGVEAEK